jgi:hypothetical protein
VSDKPKLPDTDWLLHMPAQAYEQAWTSSQPGYDADQMLAFRAEGVAAEREMCTKLCKECANHEKQRIISELLSKADEAHAERDYAREDRMRDAAACVNSC